MADRRRLPRIMGVQEIVDRLGYSRGYTSTLINSKGFPDPAYELAMGRAWLAEDVEAWIAANRPTLAESAEG